MSALDILSRRNTLLQQVFGQHWTGHSVPLPKGPTHVAPDKILSLAEYKRQLEANFVG